MGTVLIVAFILLIIWQVQKKGRMHRRAAAFAEQERRANEAFSLRDQLGRLGWYIEEGLGCTDPSDRALCRMLSMACLGRAYQEGFFSYDDLRDNSRAVAKLKQALPVLIRGNTRILDAIYRNYEQAMAANPPAGVHQLPRERMMELLDGLEKLG